MKIQNIKSISKNYNKKYISFKDNNSDVAANTAVLTLQGSNSLVNFEKDLNIVKEADAVQSNPLKAFAYKIYKAFKVFFGPAKHNNPDLETALYTYA